MIFQCEKCGKKLSTEAALEMHMETHEVIESMAIKCKECGKSFKTERNLQLHMESYHKEEVILKVFRKLKLSLNFMMLIKITMRVKR